MHDSQKSTTSFLFDAYAAVNRRGFVGVNRKNVSRHLSTFADKRWMQFIAVATSVRLWVHRYIKAQTVSQHIISRTNKSWKAGNLQATKQVSLKIGINNETTRLGDSEKVRQSSVLAIRYVCEHPFLSVCRRAVHGSSVWEGSWKATSSKQPSKQQQLGFVALTRAIQHLCVDTVILYMISSLSRVVSRPPPLMFLPFTFREQTRPLSVTQYIADTWAMWKWRKSNSCRPGRQMRRELSLLSHLVTAVGLIVVKDLTPVCDWKTVF